MIYFPKYLKQAQISLLQNSSKSHSSMYDCKNTVPKKTSISIANTVTWFLQAAEINKEIPVNNAIY